MGGPGAEASGHEHAAFLAAALPHLDAVHRLARHLSRDAPSAEDLVQETYLRAYAAFGQHRGPSTRAWLAAICMNLARSGWRRQGGRPPEVPLFPEDEPAPPVAALDGDGVFADVAARLDRAAIAAALRALPEAQRSAITLMDLCGYTAAEVASLLGCPRGTVLARVHRGRRRLAALLVEGGIDRGLR